MSSCVKYSCASSAIQVFAEFRIVTVVIVQSGKIFNQTFSPFLACTNRSYRFGFDIFYNQPLSTEYVKENFKKDLSKKYDNVNSKSLCRNQNFMCVLISILFHNSVLYKKKKNSLFDDKRKLESKSVDLIQFKEPGNPKSVFLTT